MRWRLSDGTTVYDSGRVVGVGELAERLREDVELVKLGVPVLAPVGPEPRGDQDLDLKSPEHVDAWVRARARRYGYQVESAPAFERRARESRDHVEGRVY